MVFLYIYVGVIITPDVILQHTQHPTVNAHLHTKYVSVSVKCCVSCVSVS